MTTGVPVAFKTAEANNLLYLDESNNRIGVGTATPNSKMQIVGDTLTGSSSTSVIDISQVWNTTATPTGLKMNITNTASNVNSRIVDFQVGGVSAFRIDPLMRINTGSQLTVAGHIFAGQSSNIRWTSRSIMSSTNDGIILFTGNSGTFFDRLQFGGTTSSFPAWKRSSTLFQARLADDSDYTDIETKGRAYDATTWTGSNRVVIEDAIRNKLVGIDASLDSMITDVVNDGDSTRYYLVNGDSIVVANLDETLTGTGAPVDGTTKAWAKGQIYIDTTISAAPIIYYAANKSTDPDAAATGSKWKKYLRNLLVDNDGDTEVNVESTPDRDEISFSVPVATVKTEVAKVGLLGVYAERYAPLGGSSPLLFNASGDRMSISRTGEVEIGGPSFTFPAKFTVNTPGTAKPTAQFFVADNSSNGFEIKDADGFNIFKAITTNDAEDINIGNDFTPVTLSHARGSALDTVSIAVNANAGTGGSVTIDTLASSDMAGKFTITTGTSLSAGAWVTLTFDNPFDVAPVVVVEPMDEDAAEIRPDYWAIATTTNFSVFVSADVTGAGFESTEFEFQYQVIGGK
jgi:hypothetical protein